MSEKTSKNGSMGCLTVIGIVFVILKLLAVQPVAGWSWWLVLAPFYLPAAIGIVAIVSVLVLIVIIGGKK